MRVVLRVCVILAAMIGVAIAIGSSPVVAADCITEPNRAAPPGQHWYYHLDHATDRKCWYLHAAVSSAAEAPAIELQSVHAPRRQVAPAAELPRRRMATPAQVPQVAVPQVAAPQPPAPRSEADEAALYLEFLRWKEQHRGAQ
jgi:hypothetical protein